MGKGINFDTLMPRMHEDARRAYMTGDTKHDYYKTMLNIENNFWRKSNCGLKFKETFIDTKHDYYKTMLNIENNFWRKSNCGLKFKETFIHNLLIKRRKEAEKIVQSR